MMTYYKKLVGQKFDVILMDILADEFESVYVNQFIAKQQ